MRLCARLSPPYELQTVRAGWLVLVLVLFHPPQLKAGFGDRRLDHAAVEIVGRRRIGPDDADRVPGPELLRQLAAALIVREGLQAGTGVGFENKDAHGSGSGWEFGSEFPPAYRRLGLA